MFRLVNIKAKMLFGFNYRNNNQMKHILMTFLSLWVMLPATMLGQDDVKLEISDGIEVGSVKSSIERNASLLMTAINRAERKCSDVIFQGIDIGNQASQSIRMMWENVHFHIVDSDIVEHCFRVKDSKGTTVGYQVRHIAIQMKPLNDSYQGDLNQKICINFNRDGRISGFYVAMDEGLYIRLTQEGKRFGDLDRRMFLLNWVELYRSAYDTKDISFIEKVFTGNDHAVIDSIGSNLYFSYLKRVFEKSDYINVKISDVSIVRHGFKPNYYGVALKHEWFTKYYSNGGILFMVWDFTDDNAPCVVASTIQPIRTDEKDLFNLSNIKLP